MVSILSSGPIGLSGTLGDPLGENQVTFGSREPQQTNTAAGIPPHWTELAAKEVQIKSGFAVCAASSMITHSPMSPPLPLNDIMN